MRSRTALTKVDLIAAVACICFVLAYVPVIIAEGRSRAKIEVCMANLMTLSSAWKDYADDNDGKLVNGAPTQTTNPQACPGCFYHTRAVAPSYPTEGHYNELPWIGPAWGGYDSGPTPLPEKDQKCAIETGALWDYVRDYRIYSCPAGNKGELITYIIIDSMNGMPTGGTDGSRGSGAVLHWFNNISKIRKSASRLVFIDQGKITPDSYAVYYSGAYREKWFDPPMVRHAEGSNFSFADGHAEHKNWRAKETIDVARLAEQGGGVYGVFPTSQSPQLAFQDLYWMQIHCWGKLGYVPTFPPDID